MGDYPDAFAITPNGLSAYVANGRSESVAPILISTNAPGPSIAVGNFPTAISTATNATTPLDVLDHPGAIAISPTTGQAWV